jgi:hypothetical protein
MSPNFTRTKLFIRWAENHRILVVIIAVCVCIPFLWIFRGTLELFLPIAVNATALVLATYISLRPEKKLGFKTAVLGVVVLITVGNIYLHTKERRTEKVYFDILAPSMTAMEALDFAQNAFDISSKQYQLIDVVGSYYICLKKPNTFFHRFPEWVFLFRDSVMDEILEVRVSDGRMPQLPAVQLDELKDIDDGRIAMHMKFKVNLSYLGSDNTNEDDLSDVVVILDNHGRSLIEIRGKGPEDNIPEVVESINTKVFARVRSVGRTTDRSNQWKVIENPVRLGKTIVSGSRYPAGEFYKELDAIINWKVDVEEAVSLAIAAGAQAIPPGKFGQSGGPGVFRLNNSARIDRNKTYWKTPYRVGIRPILVDANNGDVYAVNDSGEYSKRW